MTPERAMDEKALPCPFCKSADVAMHPNDLAEAGHQIGVPSVSVFYAHCDGCGAEGPQEDTHEAAIAAWNRRAPAVPVAPEPTEHITVEVRALLNDIAAAAGVKVKKYVELPMAIYNALHVARTSPPSAPPVASDGMEPPIIYGKPHTHCDDCGTQMIWSSERKESWMCPLCVLRRMHAAEESLRRAAAPPVARSEAVAWYDLALRAGNVLQQVARGIGPLGSFHGLASSDLSELSRKLSKAAHAGQVKPSLWWLTDPDGNGVIDEACVFATEASGRDYINDAQPELAGHSVVPLYAHPLPSDAPSGGADDVLRLRELLSKCMTRIAELSDVGKFHEGSWAHSPERTYHECSEYFRAHPAASPPQDAPVDLSAVEADKTWAAIAVVCGDVIDSIYWPDTCTHAIADGESTRECCNRLAGDRASLVGGSAHLVDLTYAAPVPAMRVENVYVALDAIARAEAAKSPTASVPVSVLNALVGVVMRTTEPMCQCGHPRVYHEPTGRCNAVMIDAMDGSTCTCEAYHV